MRIRVAAYVLRGPQLLVFDQVGDAEAGTQIPAGGVRPGEDPRAAVLREVVEETGLTGVTILDRPGGSGFSGGSGASGVSGGSGAFGGSGGFGGLGGTGALGVEEKPHPVSGEPRRTTYFVLRAPDGTPDAWEHVVTGAGADADLRFACRFVPLPLRAPLADRQDAMLVRVDPGWSCADA